MKKLLVGGLVILSFTVSPHNVSASFFSDAVSWTISIFKPQISVTNDSEAVKKADAVLLVLNDLSKGVENIKDITTMSASDKNLDPEKNILVVYNAENQESVLLKDYYLAHRPGFTTANTLGVHGLETSEEIIQKDQFHTNIQDPILAWIHNHPEKEIRHIVLMKGIPSRLANPDIQDDVWGSVQYALTKNSTSLVTSLDMGSVEATKAYIDKLQSMYALMPVKSIVISAENTGKNGNTYYISDAGAIAYETSHPNALETADAFKNVGSSAHIVRKGFRDPVLSTASNVSGFLSRGLYGYGYDGNYAVDGTVRFSGNSGWYLIQTMESFNGDRTAGTVAGENFQGNFIKWFAKNAFGGSHYENTPVAAVTHVEESGLGGVNDPSLFLCWDVGNLFIDCAWSSRQTIFFQAIGDPWVTK